MVALADITRAMELKSESQSLDMALRILDPGPRTPPGRIVAMVVEADGLQMGSMLQMLRQMRVNSQTMANNQTGMQPQTAIVEMTGWTYPEQMIAGIKVQIEARQAAIDEELRTIGITDLTEARHA